VRERLAECFGPLPEKTPLKPRVVGIVDRENYRVERIIFESRPTLKQSLMSYSEVAETEDYRLTYAMMPPDVLLRFDLPDCYRYLARKRLKRIEPRSAAGSG